jgi:hypothetical protein
MSLTMFISFNNEIFGFCLANSHKSRLYFLQLLKKYVNIKITNEINSICVSHIHNISSLSDVRHRKAGSKIYVNKQG